MGKKKRSKKNKISTTAEPSVGFNNPFAALGVSTPAVPKVSTPPPNPTPALNPSPKPPPRSSPPDPLDLKRCKKIVLSRERKRRRGHTAVIISGLNSDSAGLKQIAKAMKKALGCGAIVEDDTVIVLGDIPDRVSSWLEARGAARIIRGS